MSRKRTYTLGRRAEHQAETRRRIVEAAVELHTKLGPARTPISAIAERADVQRHTVYAHFPTERDLRMACSGLAAERDPLPDAAALDAIADPEQRLRRGLKELYAWYGRNAELAGAVLRDAETDVLTREIADLRFGAPMSAVYKVLARDLRPTAKTEAALSLALSFHTWRTLQDQGLGADAAVELMLCAIRCAGRQPSRRP